MRELEAARADSETVRRELAAAQEELASERKRGEEAAEQHRTLLKEATSDAAKRSLEDVDALRTRHAQALDDQAKDAQEQLAKAVAQAIAAEKSRGEAAQAKAALDAGRKFDEDLRCALKDRDSAHEEALNALRTRRDADASDARQKASERLEKFKGAAKKAVEDEQARSNAALEACKEEAAQTLERVQRELNEAQERAVQRALSENCLLYTSPSPRDS